MALRTVNLGRIMQSSFSKIETYTVRQENTVIDYKALTYTPTKKIQFDSTNKALLYLYKPILTTYITQYSCFLVPMFYLGKLIKYNPFYATYPVALPIMMSLEVFLAIKFYRQFRYLRNVVSEVYLHKDGQSVEIVYEKQFWRKIKEEQYRIIVFIPNLKTPPNNEEKKPLKGNLFPEEWPIVKKLYKPLRWSFVKYYLNAGNKLVLPSKADYVNSEILIAAFSGKLINTSKQFIENIDGDSKELALKRKLEFEPLY